MSSAGSRPCRCHGSRNVRERKQAVLEDGATLLGLPRRLWRLRRRSRKYPAEPPLLPEVQQGTGRSRGGMSRREHRSSATSRRVARDVTILPSFHRRGAAVPARTARAVIADEPRVAAAAPGPDAAEQARVAVIYLGPPRPIVMKRQSAPVGAADRPYVGGSRAPHLINGP